jgi:hypothetical protein
MSTVPGQHQLERFIARGGTRISGQGRPHAENRRNHSCGSDKLTGLAH